MEKMTLPAAFAERMQAALGEEWEAFLESYENHKYQALRFNDRKKGLTEEGRQQILSAFGASQPVPWTENGFYYPEEASPGKHPWHEMGLYYIQEPSAMSAAVLLRPEPGERVLDLCAAPGGKTTQLASFMGKEGLLISNEIHPARCRILAQNVERMGIPNCIVTNEDSETLAKHFPSYFHRIQVDAPCSGEGMFRKNPEAMTEWSPEHVTMCAERQLSILQAAADMLMPGGRLVYSTCTFAEEENEGVIRAFLEAHPEFSLLYPSMPWFSHGTAMQSETYRLWPHKLKGEGHFAAVLQKAGTPLQEAPLTGGKEKKGGKAGKSGKKNGPEPSRKALEEFLSETISGEMADYIRSGREEYFGEQLYRLPENAPQIKGLRVLRPGLHIGTVKKDRLEPSHALALFLGKEDVKTSLSLTSKDPRAAAYLRGESIFAEAEEITGKKGWCLVLIDGCSAGWGKLSGMQVKNHYPKGLRKPMA